LLDQTGILSRLVDDLRTLALAESGSLALRKERVDPAQLVRDTLSSFRAQALALGVTLDFQGQEGLLLNVDPERIRQVLSNLIGNALRYVPRGGTVSVRCEVARRPAEEACVFTVSDTGPGVSADEISHIFERFHKSGDSGGMGLGLSIAKSLVEAHGGQIEAQSQTGRGMSIRFTLPGPEWE
jgi:two-component system sensor histidine kinase BaeS